MWTTIHMASGVDEANRIKGMLKGEGFLVKSKFILYDGEEELYEILAPEFEIEDIREALIELNIY